MDWSPWRPFPDPRKGEFLTAPFGPGCYDLRRSDTQEAILFGIGGHVASRMTSLLPAPEGRGVRNNSRKRDYCLEHIAFIEYRTLPCASRAEAAEVERTMKADRKYRFGT